MDNAKNYLPQPKELQGENDQCRLTGVCSPSPTLVFLHELIITHLRELAFYLLKLKELGINNEQIKDDIINVISGIVINVEYSETQFSEVITTIYTDLLQAKELYISVCKRNDIEAEYAQSRIKFSRTLTFSDAISKGQKLFKNRSNEHSEAQINIQELFLNILKSLCIHLAELKALGNDDEASYDAVLKLINLNHFSDKFEEKNLELLNEFVRIDHQLLMKIYEIKIQKYGNAAPTKVSISTRPNKAILVAGNNLNELELILEATKDRNIDIYTHGRMIGAHAYPFFKKYPHLVGHFGKETETCLLDFAAFPGAVFVTKHCFINLKNIYRSRVFTTDVLVPKGITTIKNGDFEPLIEAALNSKGFTKAKDNGFINISLDENQILAKVADLTKKIELGEIKNIFVIGISNNTAEQKIYFDKFLNLLKDDSLALSFSYKNNKKNVFHIETDSDFPILFKAIDVLTRKIKMSDLNFTFMSTRCEVHTFTSIIYLKSLGVKNIYFGDCAPTVLNPALVNDFRNKFKLKKYTTPEADFRNIVENNNQTNS